MLKRLPLHYLLLVAGWCLSVPVKLIAAANLPWDIDYVPVIARNVSTLQDGIPPAYGTLSSVAAYNLPFLEWLHLPAMWITDDVWWIIVLTMLAFNALSTLAIYELGTGLLRPRWGVVAALLFTFSEVGVSSAYTAWAQLLLPGFFALTLWTLWQWHHREEGIYLALSGIIATAAFMTHFAAVLLFPAMLGFALVSGARWQWRWLAVGSVVVGAMLAPYLLAEAQRDFVNLRAFLAQEPRVSDDVLTRYKSLAWGTPESSQTTSTDKQTAQSTSQDDTSSAPPRWQRGIAFALSVPGQYIRIFDSGFQVGFRGLSGATATAAHLLLDGLQVLFWGGVLLAFGLTGWAWWRGKRTLHAFRDILRTTPAGRVKLLLVFLGVVATGIILTRNIDQGSYFMGFYGLQWIVVAFAVMQCGTVIGQRVATGAAVMIIVLFMALTSADRIGRVVNHDDDAYSDYNVSLFRHIDAAVNYIAAHWQGDETLTVAYDILPETRQYWWIAAWHQVDPLYRMGTPYDFLLSFEHGLTNTNHDPIGAADDPDYIVVYEPGLSRYTLDEYEMARFGAIYVLQPTP